MRQSRLMSAAEAVTNVLIGYLVAVTANWLVLPLFGFAVGVGDSAAIGLVFTCVAVIRGFALRRLFEAIRVRSRETGDS
jgi:presenilin-like A22 family membrane protease